MFEVLETTNSRCKAEQAVSELVFEEKYPPEVIETSLKITEKRFDIISLLDDVARAELETMYVNHTYNDMFPSLFQLWHGDFQEESDELYEYVNAPETHPEHKTIKQYQSMFQNNLPAKIPLVRGHNTTTVGKHPLESWTAQVGIAQMYGDTILYTVAEPEDVFMCAMYGEHIGEQEYVLTDATVESVYEPTICDQIEIYQRMAAQLD